MAHQSRLKFNFNGSPTIAPSDGDEGDACIAPAENCFGGRLYAPAQWIHMLGATPEILLEGTAAVENLVEDGGRSACEQTKIKE